MSMIPKYVDDPGPCPVCGAPALSCTHSAYETAVGGGVTIVRQLPNRDGGTGMADQVQGPVEYSAEYPHGRQLSADEAAAFAAGSEVAQSSSSVSAPAAGEQIDADSYKRPELVALAAARGVEIGKRDSKAVIVDKLNEGAKAQQAAANKAQTPADADNKAEQPAGDKAADTAADGSSSSSGG